MQGFEPRIPRGQAEHRIGQGRKGYRSTQASKMMAAALPSAT